MKIQAETVSVGVCTECPLYHDGGQGAGPGDGYCQYPDKERSIPSNAARPGWCPLLTKPLLVRVKQ